MTDLFLMCNMMIPMQSMRMFIETAYHIAMSKRSVSVSVD
jgi:hypothetical protein